MKYKNKLIIFFAILLFVLLPIINIVAQTTGNEFVNSKFVQDIVKKAKEFEDGKFKLTIENIVKPDTNKDFYNSSAVFKMQTNIEVKDTRFLGSGKYFSALWIDADGAFDLGDAFYGENKDGYNPIVTSNDNKYKTFYGTATGKHYLIGILSDEVPYFGNIYNNQGGMNTIARKRYIENIETQLKEKKASVFVVEFDIDLKNLGN